MAVVQQSKAEQSRAFEMNRLIEKCMGIVTNLPIGHRIGLMLSFAHADENLQRSYLELAKKIESTLESHVIQQKEDENRQPRFDSWRHFNNYDNYYYHQSLGPSAAAVQASPEACRHPDPLPNLWHGIKNYRLLTNLILTFDLFKLLMVVLVVDRRLLPLEWNCYLWGRSNLHVAIIDYAPVLYFSQTALALIWRYITLVSSNLFEFDLIVFLLNDDQTVKAEVDLIGRINLESRQKQIINKLVPMNVLQKTLFYKIDYESYTNYRLKPNRTLESRGKLEKFTNLILINCLVTFVIIIVGCVPFILQCLVFDIYYIRNYPSCCPELEQLAYEGNLSYWQATLNQCPIRKYTVTFDLIDTVTLAIEATLMFIMPMGIGTLITGDLVVHWRAIDMRIRKLKAMCKLSQHHFSQPEAISNRSLLAPRLLAIRRHTTRRDNIYLSSFSSPSSSSFNESKFQWLPGGRRMLDPLEDELADLQAQIVDFFQSLRVANKFAGLIIGFNVMLFLVTVFLTAYFASKVPYFWSIVMVWLLLGAIYMMFLSGSLVMLYLKRNVDRSYPDICSLMAFDRSPRALRWIRITEKFIYKSGTAFTIFQRINFTWHLVFNLVATSISFLVAIETYKIHSSNTTS